MVSANKTAVDLALDDVLTKQSDDRLDALVDLGIFSYLTGIAGENDGEGTRLGIGLKAQSDLHRF